MTLSIALDILLAVLLVASIGYAAVLNRKLGSLRRHKEELEQLASTFAESTTRAEDSIRHLKGTTSQLQSGIDAAEGLCEDLKFLIDRGTSAADRLEGAVRGARNLEDGSAVAGKQKEKTIGVETVADVASDEKMTGEKVFETTDDVDAAEATDDEVSRALAEKDLIEALRQVR